MKACVFTLGCKMNEVESESLMRGLEEMGYETTEEPSFADLYVINTCAVTAEAEKKSRQAVARMRKFNRNAKIVVCGCASQNRPESFTEKEGVTLVTGARKKDRVLALLRESGNFPDGEEGAFCELPEPKRTRTRAFLRIQDGCNRFCSYCLIPHLRGRSRSRGLDSVVREAQNCGAKEIVLTGIDVSSYRDGDTDLCGLLLALKDVPSRVRLGSLEAGIIDERFLSALKEAGNVVPHFHLSLQSGSDAVLKKMNRRYTREEYLEKCALLYRAFPDAAITTDVIVGFPTETDADFQQSLKIVEEAAFAHVHVFPFSAREGTPAAKMKDLPVDVKRARAAELGAAARAAEERYLSRFTGREAVALFESDGGYTENYIRVYAERGEEGALCRVRLGNREKDGLHAEILEVL